MRLARARSTMCETSASFVAGRGSAMRYRSDERATMGDFARYLDVAEPATELDIGGSQLSSSGSSPPEPMIRKSRPSAWRLGGFDRETYLPILSQSRDEFRTCVEQSAFPWPTLPRSPFQPRAARAEPDVSGSAWPTPFWGARRLRIRARLGCGLRRPRCRRSLRVVAVRRRRSLGVRSPFS